MSIVAYPSPTASNTPENFYRSRRDQTGFVIPGYGDFSITYSSDLHVVPSTNNGAVLVKPGAAIYDVYYYISDDDVELTFDSAVNNRIDAIYVGSSGGNSARLQVAKGTEAALPYPPGLPSTAEILIAYVWFPAGFNAAATLISGENIHDKREFGKNLYTATNFSSQNMMHNSEFMAFSVITSSPDGWGITVVPAVNIAPSTPLSIQTRGKGVRMQGNNGQGIDTNIRCPSYPVASNLSMTTLAGQLKIDAGAALVTITTALETITKRYYAQGNNELEFFIRFLSYDEVNLSIECGIANSDITIGQVSMCRGVNADLTPKHEILMLCSSYVDGSWNATAKSTGTTAIDLGASFTGSVPPYARAVIVKMRCSDSGSVAGSAGMYTSSYDYPATPPILSEIKLDNLPNNSVREMVGYAPIYHDGTTDNYIRIGTIATGAGTLSATLEIVGIIT